MKSFKSNVLNEAFQMNVFKWISEKNFLDVILLTKSFQSNLLNETF